MMALVKVCNLAELPPGRAKLVEVDGVEIGVFHVDDGFYAVQNTCPHREGYLHEGPLQGTKVTCPWHFAVFDLRSGEVLEGPAESNLRTYRVLCQNGEIQLELQE
jgi:nitrite reductase/ring-hydroxylating ferredoxin subunit